MSQGLYSGVSGLALGSGLYRNVSGLWGGASGLIDGFGGGTAPALSLDFANQSYVMNDAGYQFQDLIRFSRTTAGTFVGSDGFIQNSPVSKNLLLWTQEFNDATWTKVAASVQSNLLLRSQEYDNASWVKNTSFIQTNLLTYSEQFDNAAWTKGNATVTANTTVAPDGTTTADTITGVTAGVSNFIRPTALPTAVATQYTFSIWVRAGTATTCSLLLRDPIAGGGTNLPVTSQIVSGPGSISGSPIVNVTGLSTTEWTRVAITLVSPATAGNTLQPTFYPETALSATTALSNIIWGAQLIQGTAPGNYQRTEATALAVGYTAPDGSLTADKLVIDNTAPFTSSYIRQSLAKAASPITYTSSVYVKAGEFNQVRIVVRDNTAASTARVEVSLVDGSIVSAPSVTGAFTNPSATVTAAGNGWYRITLTATTSTETLIWGQTIFAQDSVATTGDGASGIYIWGSQFVTGAAAGDYAPTTSTTVALQYTAPNGLPCADKIVEDSSNGYHSIREIVTVANGAYTFTVYLKAGERSRAIVSMSDNTTGYAFVGVDLTDGTTFTPTALSVGSWTAVSSSVTPVGGGWYRVRVTGTANAGTQIAGTLFPTDGTSATFLGDGSSGFYAWGAQLEVGSTATSYSRNADGLYPPRFDYDPVTLAPKGILIEEQRTNLLTYSEQFDNAAWLINASSVTVTANAATSPDGTVDADKLIIANGVSSGTTTYLYTNISKSAVATTYTFSCYAKEAEYDLFRLVINDNAASANFALGAWSLVDGSVNEVPSVGGTFTNPSGTVTAVGNGWYRITLTFTSSTETSLRVRIYPRDSSGVVVGDGVSGIYIFGAQLEAGAFVTSYIPTVASTVIRAADITLVSGSIFTSFYNQNAGTLFAFVIPQVSNAQNQFIATISADGTTTNRASMFKATSGFGGFRTTSSGTAANPTGPVSAPLTGNVRHKVALSVTTGPNNVTCAIDGVLGTAATLSTMPTGINSLRVGVNEAGTGDWLNGNISAVRYYSVSQTTAELQALTTL